MDPPVPALHDRAVAAADRLLAAESVRVVSHDDADGLTSAAIATTALERAGLAVDVAIKHGLDEAAIDDLATTGGTVLFTDLGSGGLDRLAELADTGSFTPVVADHHEPADGSIEHHLNPHCVGLDGGRELAGAGTAYVLARTVLDRAGVDEPDPRELAALAVVGAVGDRQTVDGELVGANAAVAADGEAVGVIESGTDLAIYGTQTRPLPKLLEYTTDVRIPGITGNRQGAIRFLEDLDVELRTEAGWPTWADLGPEKRTQVASALLTRAVERGVPAERIDALVGTSYILPREEPGTQLRDASEFATLLNATARYEESEIGLAVCRGDRDGALDRAETLLKNHRRNISAGIESLAETGTTEAEHLQWVHAGEQIRATIVGIVAGMALGEGDIDRHTPIVAFANKPDGGVKVSARANGRLGDRGLNLGTALREAATTVGGEGGGHAMAAGATIPEGTEATFVSALDERIGAQLN
ncbi:phosphoesterase RecJ domain-containing protein [Halodesulfurarchaeum formicicum]|uniref:Phosphoesterase RecJ domain-containing protein n=1 Tax=Halodesulfurarchaeum formicicum TaxID=1873524 RepID=A0A1D8S1N8_9EURY|nr:DHH family phosphoesterase [Halodesulfurarchaeum formicicum]AOW79268.1 phosphoesterase RecJ domain-containing protein [Halodesulfurarchaeum formicicum]